MVEGITNEEFNSWKQDLQNGMTVTQLAKKYNRAYSVIQYRFRHEPKFRKITTEEKKTIKELFDNGKKATEISKLLNIEHTTISRILKSKIRNIKRKELNLVKEQLDKLTQFEIGWIVGLIEGEGCMYITYEGKRLRARITIANVDSSMIDKLHLLLPFSKKYYTERKNRQNWKKLYWLAINHKKQVKLFCEFFYPYFKCKQQEAGLLIKAIDNNMDKTIASELSIVKSKKNSKVIIR